MNWQSIFYNLTVPTERRKRFRDLVKKRFQCNTWATNNGQIIPVTLMKDDHLENAWRFVVRHALDAWTKQDTVEFERRYSSTVLLNGELNRRGKIFHQKQMDELEALFEDIKYSDYDDDFMPLDHYEAMHYWKGDF